MNGGAEVYLVSYDIASNKIRNKVAKNLLNYGKRVQYSVFECDIDAQRCEKLYKELEKITGGTEDGNIRFYYINSADKGRHKVIGNAAFMSRDTGEDVVII